MDYISKTRTNYFKVKDDTAFEDLIKRCSPSYIEIFTAGEGEEKRYGFLCDGSVDGIYDEENEDVDYDAFIAELQNNLPSDEAVLIQEVGSEGFRYLSGGIHVITANDTYYVNMQTHGIAAAKRLLNNPDFNTQMEY